MVTDALPVFQSQWVNYGTQTGASCAIGASIVAFCCAEALLEILRFRKVVKTLKKSKK